MARKPGSPRLVLLQPLHQGQEPTSTLQPSCAPTRQHSRGTPRTRWFATQCDFGLRLLYLYTYVYLYTYTYLLTWPKILIFSKQGTLQQQGDRHHGDLEDEDDLRLPWQPVLETHGDLSRSRLISLDMFVNCWHLRKCLTYQWHTFHSMLNRLSSVNIIGLEWPSGRPGRLLHMDQWENLLLQGVEIYFFDPIFHQYF